MKIYSRIFWFITRFLDLENYEVIITQRKDVIESFWQVWKTCYAKNNNLKKARFVKKKKADTWNFSTGRGRHLEDRVGGSWEIFRSRAIGNREITRKIFRKNDNVWLIHRQFAKIHRVGNEIISGGTVDPWSSVAARKAFETFVRCKDKNDRVENLGEQSIF